jgi:hypothetical protein
MPYAADMIMALGFSNSLELFENLGGAEMAFRRQQLYAGDGGGAFMTTAALRRDGSVDILFRVSWPGMQGASLSLCWPL